MKRTNSLMRVFAVLMLTMILVSSFAVSASAAVTDTEIGTCKADNTSDDGRACAKLQEIYGTTSSVKFSTSETETCKYATSITLSTGKVITVYLSQKPTTGDIGVQMGSDGKLEIDGITGGNNGIASTEIKYCSVKNEDALCKAVIELYINDFSYYQQSVSYRTEKTSIYKYKAEFRIADTKQTLYFDKLPLGTESTNKCDNGYLTEKVCRRLYDVFGSDKVFSLRETPFFRHPVEVVLESGDDVVVWLLDNPTPEEKTDLEESKMISSEKTIVTVIFICVVSVGIAVSVALIIFKRILKQNM